MLAAVLTKLTTIPCTTQTLQKLAVGFIEDRELIGTLRLSAKHRTAPNHSNFNTNNIAAEMAILGELYVNIADIITELFELLHLVFDIIVQTF